MKKCGFIAVALLLVAHSAVCEDNPTPTRRYFPSPKTPEMEFLSCFEGCPSADVLRSRLQGVLGTVRGTGVEDDALLALGEAEIQNGNASNAIPLLRQVTALGDAVKLDMDSLSSGSGSHLPEGVEGERSPPCISSDYAFLMLAKAYERIGQPNEAWKALSDLSGKYPHGYCVREIGEAIERLQKKDADNAATPRMQELRKRVFHLQALLEQQRLAKKHDEFASKRLDILSLIVQLYEPILTDDEIIHYCDEGLKEVSERPNEEGMHEKKYLFSHVSGSAKQRKAGAIRVAPRN